MIAAPLNWLWDNSEKLSHFATVFAGLLTVAAIAVAVIQIRKTRQSQERATAFELYSQFLIQTLHHPEFASPRLTAKDVAKEVWPGKPGKFAMYEVYVDLMIVAFEELLNVNPQQEINIEAYFATYLDAHKTYLRSARFQSYGSQMDSKFRKFLNEWNASSVTAPASSMLRAS
jgi:hypothetical protein